MKLPMLRRSRFLLAAGLALGVPLAVTAAVAAPQIANAATSHRPAPSTMTNWWTTFYGWTDNTPPGPAISHTTCRTPGGTVMTKASGIGTYNSPVTMAWPTDLGGPWCQIGYVPDLKKYFMHADQCNPCGGQNTKHWDLWMGGDRNSTKAPEHKALLNCEGTWTVHTTVILSPPGNLPVDTTPLFTPPTTCHGGQGDSGSVGS